MAEREAVIGRVVHGSIRWNDIDLTQSDGPVLSTVQLAKAVGLSAETVRRDIELGELDAGCRMGGQTRRKRYLIRWEEARRYAVQMGVIRVSA